VRVCSVHANRDTGIFLGADDKADRRLGAEVLKNNCRVADAVGASLVVVHAWDTRATAIEARAAADTINTVAAEFGDITLAVENLPLSAEGWSQEQLMHTFDRMLEPRVGFTLDLSWSSLYDNFDQLLSLLPRVKNVHVQGRLVRDASQGNTLRPRAGNLVLETAISELAAQGYSGQWTLELNKAQAVADFVEAIHYLEDLLSGL
jgi:sugar phosphate isomerase/epimerase